MIKYIYKIPMMWCRTMKNTFELIEYNGIPYPEGYTSKIKEIAGHLDKETIEQAERYSLHTEYSYGKRKFDSPILAKYESLRNANKGGVPQLWKSEEWSKEFALFLIDITSGKNHPEIIEIDPPFNDYADIEHFIKCYKAFEKVIKEAHPNTKFFIENRSGAVYHGGKFVVSKADEIVSLCEAIEKYNLDLGIVLDFQQLLTAERLDTLKFNAAKYKSIIEKIHPYQRFIKGIHIWGKKKSQTGRWVAHCGTLDTYFDGNNESKNAFIGGIERICDDGAVRFLVPEVNSGAEDLKNIIEEIKSAFDELISCLDMTMGRICVSGYVNRNF